MSSTREAEHRRWLESETADETPDGSFRSAPLSTAAENVSVSRTRDRDNAIEFQNQQTDPTTPEGRKVAWQKSVAEENERLNRLGAAARAKNERIRQEAERVAEARRIDSERIREARQTVVAKVVSDDIRASIKAIMMPNLDILDECRRLVESQRKLHVPEYWSAAVRTVRQRQNQK